MATVHDPILTVPSVPETGLAAAIDRWIYVFMAALFVATALTGFVPTSIGKSMAVSAGMRPPFPPILHVHATLMGSWLLVLLAQATLMATGRDRYHFQLGMAGFVIAPAMVIAGVFLVPTMIGQLAAAIASAPPPPVLAELQATSVFATNIVLVQLLSALVFITCICTALTVRRTDPETHKRLMFLGTVAPLGAAIDRIAWIPTTMPVTPVTTIGYALLWIAPMLLWDLYRRKKLQRAYVIWFCIYVPSGIAATMLWNTPWWQATARGMLGLA